MKLIDLIGYSGAFIVTYSNIPQIWLFIKQKHAYGISISSGWIGLIGLILRTVYLIHSTHGDLIALGPYFFAILCTIITLYYCYFPTKSL